MSANTKIELFRLHVNYLCTFIKESYLDDTIKEQLLYDIKQLHGPHLEPLFVIRERYYDEKAILNKELRRNRLALRRQNTLYDLNHDYKATSIPIKRQSHFNFETAFSHKS